MVSLRRNELVRHGEQCSLASFQSRTRKLGFCRTHESRAYISGPDMRTKDGKCGMGNTLHLCTYKCWHVLKQKSECGSRKADPKGGGCIWMDAVQDRSQAEITDKNALIGLCTLHVVLRGGLLFVGCRNSVHNPERLQSSVAVSGLTLGLRGSHRHRSHGCHHCV